MKQFEILREMFSCSPLVAEFLRVGGVYNNPVEAIEAAKKINRWEVCVVQREYADETAMKEHRWTNSSVVWSPFVAEYVKSIWIDKS